jgi:hypothetical protein
MLNATITTTSILVLCPECGEPQPSPGNGSDRWLPDEMRSNHGKRQCVACDKTYRLVAVMRALIAL